MLTCQCDIVCLCNKDIIITPSVIGTNTMVTISKVSVGECLLGKTLPVISHVATADQLNLFNISNDYRTYSYTLSPKGVGIMANKSRDQQYNTLKRLHNEVLSGFDCSYIINIEIYPGSDNDLHCHGVMRFRSHNKKELFKKTLKDKITLLRKGTYHNLIDCEFVNKFDKWADYINKSQDEIVSKFSYFPFIHIDYSFHQASNDVNVITVPVASKTKVKSKPVSKPKKVIDPQNLKQILQLDLIKAQSKVDKLLSRISNL